MAKLLIRPPLFGPFFFAGMYVYLRYAEKPIDFSTQTFAEKALTHHHTTYIVYSAANARAEFEHIICRLGCSVCSVRSYVSESQTHTKTQAQTHAGT